jgi:ABC-type uncharacterized transport system permease subunit
MSLIHIDRNPSPRQLAVFGLLWLVFFTAVGGVLLARGGSPTVVAAVWAVAAVVPAAGWVFPRLMLRVYLGMLFLALPLGFVVSHVVLAVAYYLVLTPTGLLMRAVGRDPMQRRFDRRAQSYWVPREPSDDPKRYLRQF